MIITSNKVDYNWRPESRSRDLDPSEFAPKLVRPSTLVTRKRESFAGRKTTPVVNPSRRVSVGRAINPCRSPTHPPVTGHRKTGVGRSVGRPSRKNTHATRATTNTRTHTHARTHARSRTRTCCACPAARRPSDRASARPAARSTARAPCCCRGRPSDLSNRPVVDCLIDLSNRHRRRRRRPALINIHETLRSSGRRGRPIGGERARDPRDLHDAPPYAAAPLDPQKHDSSVTDGGAERRHRRRRGPRKDEPTARGRVQQRGGLRQASTSQRLSLITSPGAIGERT